MTRWTLGWAILGAAALTLEFAAFRRGGYWATLTGHIERAMLLHPVVALLVLGVASALVWHFALDYVILRLRAPTP